MGNPSLIQLGLFGAMFWLVQTGNAQNLVTNGGFETGDFTGWALINNYYSNQSQIISSGSGPLHSGSFAAEFEEALFMGGGQTRVEETSLSQILTTQAGSSYSLSFWLYLANGGGCNVIWNGTDVTDPTIYNHQAGGWTNIEIVISATGTNTVLEFAFYPYGANVGSAVVAFIDDISVTQLPAGYNKISGQLLSGGAMQLSFVGNASSNYALDRTFNLALTNWVPIATNTANAGGTLVFTNTPNSTTNNFWRIRSVR